MKPALQAADIAAREPTGSRKPLNQNGFLNGPTNGWGRMLQCNISPIMLQRTNGIPCRTTAGNPP